MQKQQSLSQFCKDTGLKSVKEVSIAINKSESWLYRNWNDNRELVEYVVIGVSIKKSPSMRANIIARQDKYEIL